MTTKLSAVTKMFTHDNQRKNFKKYIEYIRFPHLKNFEKDFKVNFNFPLTFLVGPNGTGKSSLLQALYGCPKGKSLGRYWFNTKLDPITDKHYLIYSYKTEITKKNVEVIKQRVYKESNPDYWEPARPNKSFGMDDLPKITKPEEASQTRWNQLNKKVLYLDFRYELSAYDKYFYFGFSPNTAKMKTKQDLIRRYAHKLETGFTNNCETYLRTMKSSKPQILSSEELKIISKILGKDYKEAKILKHNYYKQMDGYSVLFKTKREQNYSEAFAGSGETAVVKLVHDIYNVETYSLIILDEPETSLHPAAQKELIQFILDQIVKKKLQVVISTHSSDLIENMPKEAIKVLHERKDTGKIDIIENVIPEEAFYHIGHSLPNKKILLVEDKLAKIIVEKSILKIGGEALSNLFDVKHYHGGESRLKTDFMPVYSKEDDGKHFIIFDGDMKASKIDINTLATCDKNKEILRKKIQEDLKIDLKKIIFATDSNKPEQEVQQLLDFIKYHHDNVFFLPKEIPEEIIWSNEVLMKTDIEEAGKDEIIQVISTIGKETKTNVYKEAFRVFAKYMFDNDSSNGIEQAHNYFLIRWLKKEDESLNEIKEIIEVIKIGTEQQLELITN